MALVNLMVNQRSYTIACDDGEEEHLRELSAHVDSKIRELLESVGQAGEQRLLLMAALLIADDYFAATALAQKHAQELGRFAGAREEVGARLADIEQKAVTALESATKRVEDIAAGLAPA